MRPLEDSIVSVAEFERFEKSYITSPDEELALLRWVKNSTEVFRPPEIRVVEAFGTKLNRVTVSYKSSPDGRPIIGCGRDINLSTAMSRAYGEAIERVVAQKVFAELSEAKCYQIVFHGRDIRIIDCAPTSIPPRGLRTSNGWACHFNLSSSVHNSIAEAMERHILLHSFLRWGWQGFSNDSSVYVLGKFVRLLRARVQMAGYRAGLALANLVKHPGFTTGYSCGLLSGDDGKFWEKAALESAEPAMIWDNLARAELIKRSESLDPMEWTQAHYALGSNGCDFLDEGEELRLENPVEASLLLIDVQRALRLPFPFFASYVFSEELIPLAFKRRIDGCTESARWMNRVLHRYSLSVEFPGVHPVV